MFARNKKLIKRVTQAEHHLHLRKRFHLRDLKDYSFIDHLVYIAGPMVPIAILPQVLTVWVNRETAGVPLLTWIVLSFTSVIMAAYAIKHKVKPLIITYIPLFFLNIAVVIGILLFRQ